MMLPLATHREHLRNREATLERARRELEGLQANVRGLEASCDKLTRQIMRAEHEGKDRFDDERYKPGDWTRGKP